MTERMTGPAPHAPDRAAPSPARTWMQRGVFFAAGVAMTFVAGRMAEVLPWDDGFEETAVLGGVLAVLLTLRMLRGAWWRWASYAAGVAAVWGLLFVSMLAGPEVEAWIRGTSFDSDRWKRAQLGLSETRVWMADDLLDRPLTGMQLADVDALLGPDDSVRGTGYGAGYWDDWDRVWWLGPERGFIRIDSEWLVLRADAKGAVVEARLVRD